MATPTPTPSPAASAQRPQGLLIASTLCWIWGILAGLMGVALLVPAAARPKLGSGLAIFALASLVLGVVFCIAGYLVRKARLIGGWIAVVTAGLLSVLQLLTGARAGSVALAVNLPIIAPVGWHWPPPRRSSRPGCASPALATCSRERS